MNKNANGEVSKKAVRILDTAQELFSRHGFKRVTVEEICRQADASKMTFYKYYSNKIDLIKRIFNRWFDEGYARLDEIDAMPISFPEKLGLIVKWKLELVEKFSSQFMDEYLQPNQELGEFLQTLSVKSYGRFSAWVVEAQQRGDIRPDVRPEFLLLMMEKLQELIRDPRLKKLYPDYVDLAREVNNYFFYGILPVPRG